MFSNLVIFRTQWVSNN